MTSADFVVLGAGPAGLGAAHRLASRGFEVIVVERRSRVGGLAGSFRVAGQTVDHGSHRLHPSTPPPILGLLTDLLGDELQLRKRNGRIRVRDRWVSFPLKPVDVARSLGPGFLWRATLSATAATFRRRDQETFAGFVYTGLGSFMGEAFYYPYATKIWGLAPDLISGEQARRRIGADTPLKLAGRLLGPGRGPRERFYYPAGGFGRISEALAESATARGAELRLGQAVVSLRIRQDRFTVRTSVGDEIESGHVWSTLPLTRLAALSDPPPGPALPRLDYRSMLLVYLVVPTDRYSPFDAHYIPQAGVPVTRLSEPKNYREGPDPAGQTVLCAEIPCGKESELWSQGDEELGRLVREHLPRLGMPDPRPIGVAVRRLPFAYPVYRVGFEAQLGPLLDWVATTPGLISLGRQGLFAHDNTHHALAMAWAAADAVTDATAFDESRWSAAMGSFQDHVVED